MTRIVGLIVFLFCSVNVASAEIKVEKVVSTSADHFLGGHLTLKVANLDALISEGIENLRLQLNGRVLIDSRATASAAADGTIEFPSAHQGNERSLSLERGIGLATIERGKNHSSLISEVNGSGLSRPSGYHLQDF